MSLGVETPALSNIEGVRQRRRVGLFYGVLVPVLLLCALTAISIGSSDISLATILRVLAMKLLPANWFHVTGISESDVVIVWLIRVPRVAVAMSVGAGLATAGTIMQGLFRNPLAEPGLAGVGPGAVLGAVITFVAGWSMHSVITLPLAAIAGALVALVLVYVLATRGGVTPIATLLLAGIAVGTLLSAISSLLLSLRIIEWQLAQEIVFWMMGGLDARTWTHVWLSAPFILLGTLAAYVLSRDLDLLQQGEETAASLGLNIEASKRTLVLTAALLTGASVAVAGMLAFVGLVVPHGARLVLGPSSRRLIPASALSGAAFLILSDLAARTIHPPTEIRLGVVTALCGGPIFIVMLWRRSWEVIAR